MTPTEIAKTADALLVQLRNEPDIGMSNYKQELVDYRQMLNDTLVLVRETAQILIAREIALAAAVAVEKEAQTK